MYKKAEKYVDKLEVDPSIEEIVEAKNKALTEVSDFRDKALKLLEDKYEEIKSKLDAKGEELSKTFVTEKKKYLEVIEGKSLKNEEDDELSEDEIINLILKSVD